MDSAACIALGQPHELCPKEEDLDEELKATPGHIHYMTKRECGGLILMPWLCCRRGSCEGTRKCSHARTLEQHKD